MKAAVSASLLLVGAIACQRPPATAPTIGDAAFVIAYASEPEPAPARVAVNLVAVGDVQFGRYHDSVGGDGPQYRAVTTVAAPFADVPILATADIAFANLETPIMAPPARIDVWKNRVFRADPESAAVLANAGFDVVSLANNHVLNLGSVGAAESRRHLQAAHIDAVGAGATVDEALRPVVLVRHGVRVAFIALSVHDNGRAASGHAGAVAYVHQRELIAEARPLITQARANADSVVVSLHWGTEFAPHPTDEQRHIAHALIDGGADVLIGHHPHVVQDLERWHRGVIAYSLGNFLFDQPLPSRRQTAVLALALVKDDNGVRIESVELLPYVIDHDDHVPRPSHDERWNRQLAALSRLP